MSSSPDSPVGSPLSPAQRDLLLEASSSPGAAPLVIGTSVALGPEVDPDRWRRAAEAVFAAEPGMRLRLDWRDGEPWQELDPNARLRTEVAELKEAGSPREDVGAWTMARLAARPAIETDPSWAHALVRDRTGTWHAVLMSPHIFVDGHAYRHFFERTARVYEDPASSGPPASVERLFDAAARASREMDLPDTIAFWRARLKGVEPLALRTRRSESGSDHEQLLTLDSTLSAAIEELCSARGIHPADFFLAAYAIVLERFREREGSWIAYTIKSTRGPDERDLMGCFYRAMPAVFDPGSLAVSARIADLFARIREERQELRGRMRISMLALQDLLPRGGMRAVFNYYDFHEVRAFGSVRQLRSHFFHRPDEIHLVIARRAEGFELRLRFHTAFFPEERLLERLAVVASRIASGAVTIGDCDWILPDEKPAAAAGGTTPAPDVLELFERRAREKPDAAALVFGGERLSYAELDAVSNRLARRLVREGVGPETLVGIHLDRSFEQVAAILAVLKAGGAYVPIDPEYPEERVRFILADSRVAILVGRAPEGGGIPPSCLTRIAFHSVRSDFAEESSDPLEPLASPENLAYVIYTSGSTGRPKGTLVTRRNLARLFSASDPLFDFDASDVWTLLHSCAFDFSVWEIFGALVHGAKLVVVPARVARSPSDLARLIDGEGVTVLNQTPSAFFHLAAEAELGGKSLRYVIFGGEALETRRLGAWLGRFGDARPELVNMYGITETTVHVTRHRVTAADAAREESPIGRPLPDLDVHLVDPEGRLVPRGTSGEIQVGGAGVARGYLDREELTRERFVEDRFRPGPGRRVYRSGDLARETPDGGLEFLGRIDDQVKIRGYRVEPGEVASVLAEHPAVREAIVLAQPGPEGASLVGYAIPREASGFDEAELLRFLRRRLPVYMTCSRVLAVEAFPLTPHGKLDREALPRPEGRAPGAADFVAPRTAAEELVASLFSEATGSPRVGAEDDFFNLGGHSLAAMRVAARLREVFQVAAGPSLLFERPTPAKLAEYVEERRGTASGSDRPVFPSEPRRDELAMTYAQERVFLLQSLHPEMVAYNFEAAMRFHGRLDAALLERALTRIVERHEAFRTTFHEENGRTFQRVHERALVFFEARDLSKGGREAAGLRAEELRREIASRPFDPSKLPLVEWRLVRIAEDEHVLLHHEHHLVHDGWSFVVFVRDLLETYRALCEDRAPSLPASVSLGDYAAGHRRWIEGPAGEEQRRFWREKLAGVPERLDIPADRARPTVFSFRGDQFRFDLPDGLVAALRAAARREGLTLYMLMLAAFSLVLSRLSGAEDLAIAAGVANRRWEEIENTVGMLLNNVVFRLRPRGGVSARDYLREVREEVLGAVANQDLPFGEIVAAAGVPRSLSESPLSQAFFSSYEGPLPDLDLPGLQVFLEAGLPNGSAKFDWNVIVLSQPGRSGGAERITILWEYSTDLFEKATMERARTQFLAAIASLLEDLDRPVSEVSISDEAERELLLASAQGASTPYPREAGIPELFARQVSERGNSVAVRDRETVLTYGELADRAGRIAVFLRERGVAPEEPVAFLLPRGAGAVAAMLGILQAGAAYMPLSPKDPPARLARLIEDGGARLVIADSSLSGEISGARVKVLRLEKILAGDAPPSPPSAPLPAGNSLAAILFTSGSTGRPKGVEVLHRGIVRLVIGADYASLGPEEKILQLAPLSFDASSFEIWGALLHGGEVVVFPEDLPSAGALGEAIARHGITTMWLNASLFNAIVDENPAVLAPLRQLLIGGEALSVAHVERARRALPATALVNGYGPTENTTFSCCHRISERIDPAAASIPIGRPIAHSRARLLDPARRLSPAGAVGEIFVGGDGLARGYRSLPEATAGAFVPDPFDPDPAARLYRTGDLGRLRPDGTFEYRGRRDSQVKIRGFRIEPGEIEAALVRQEGVAAASVQAFDDAARGKILVAFLIPEKGAAIDPAEVLRGAARELPPHMVPARAIARPALPITPHGKIDSAMLVREAREAARMEVFPRPGEAKSALEGVVAAAFAEVLGRPDFGADEDFFAAGGHSLLVFRVLARLERSLQARIEPSVFLHGPTPRRLAEELERRAEAAGQTQAPAVGGGASIVRVTPGKRPLFFVPGGEGGDLALGVYARLALYLPGTGFYGFRVVRNGGGVESGASSVEDLAARFAADLKQTLPDGEYDLAGGCIGGIVAYEMARQLARSGRPARTLVLLDTLYPSSRRRIRQRLRGWSSRARRRALAILEGSGLRPASRKAVYESFSKLLPFDEHEAAPVVPLEWIRFGDMLLSYRPKPLRVRAVLLASQELMKTDGPRRWAEALGGDLTVRVLPGTHWSYIREHVAEVGAALRETLEAPR